MNLDHCAFLDIETSWPSNQCVNGRWPSSQEDRVARQKRITVIGVYKPFEGTIQLIRPAIDRERLLGLMEGVETLFTYNGARFDLPVIHNEFGIDLTTVCSHRDLMHDCWRNNLKGGLKRVEQTLGIHRDTEGVDGIAAMNLWAAYRGKGDTAALELLLRYNREDVENLKILAEMLGIGTRTNAVAKLQMEVPDAQRTDSSAVTFSEIQTDATASIPLISPSVQCEGAWDDHGI